MIFTGERVILGEGDVDLLNEHLARYRFAQRFSPGKVVLDAACGSGYGSAMLGENAQAVIGVDISSEAVEYSRAHFAAVNVQFSTADCMALPFPAAHFDVVVAFEIIEHLQDAEAFLKELDRVLKPSGVLLLSTPNRLYYTEERGEINPFHYREFSFHELQEILRPLFPHSAILLENHIPGLLISEPDAQAEFGIRNSESGIRVPESVIESRVPIPDPRRREQRTAEQEEARQGAYYFIAICSHRPLEPISPLLYLPSTGNVLREREKHIRQLTGFLAKADAEAERAGAEALRAMAAEQQVRSDAEREFERLRVETDAEIGQLRARVEELNGILQDRTEWARHLDRELAEKGACLLQMQQDYDSKVQWAVSLESDLQQTRTALQRLQQDYDSKVQWAMSLESDLQQTRTALQRLQQEFDERTAWALQLNAELQERYGDLRVLYRSLWYRIGKNLRLSPVPPSDQP